jgi:hypothetical protein
MNTMNGCRNEAHTSQRKLMAMKKEEQQIFKPHDLELLNHS